MGKLQQACATRAHAPKLLARDDYAETIFDGDDHSQQDDRRKWNDVVEQIIFIASLYGRSDSWIRRGSDDQLAQFIDNRRGAYGLLPPVIWTSSDPSILTGMGETGSACGKNRSSLCRYRLLYEHPGISLPSGIR